MYHLLKFEKAEEYFQTMTQRNPKGVYFCRFVGYDDELLVFYRRYQIEAQKNGLYLHQPLSNPVDSQVSQFLQIMGTQPFALDQPRMSHMALAWFQGVDVKKVDLFSSAVLEMLSALSRQGVNLNILKNAYIKFMCWGKGAFFNTIRRLGEPEIPKILYEGDISKYEVYFLRVLSRAGCDVLYLNFISDDSYLKTDAKSAYSQAVSCRRKGMPQQHFTKIDLSGIAQKRQMKSQVQQTESMLVTNTWLTGSILEDMLKPNQSRGTMGQTKVYNLFGGYFGIDDPETYLRRLYKWKQSVSDSGKHLLLLEEKLSNPTVEETKNIQRSDTQKKEDLILHLAAAVQPAQEKSLNRMAQSAFIKVMSGLEETALPRIFNQGVIQVCWLNRYLKTVFQKWEPDKPPAVCYYGVCNDKEALFLTILSYMPLDVLVISSDMAAVAVLQKADKANRMLCQSMENSTAVMPFPKTEPKVRIATAAYAAERELDTVLYSDTGLFRNKQFTRSNPVTLKTTYDEIGILWKEEAKYRTGFETGNNQVTVPNIFARVCGVMDENTVNYFNTVAGMITDKTVLITKIPFITPQAPNRIRSSVHKFFANGSILPDVIKRHRDYPYDHLSESIQDYILDKLQQMIDLNWIKADAQGVEYAVLSTVLNLDTTTLRLIQQFDFTREIPKVVVVDVDESTMSLEDNIYLLFLNLIGFDIVVFTPTGYRNIDKYIKEEAYVEYQVGPYMFNLNIPNLFSVRQRLKPDTGGGGLFGRLFRRG